MPRLSSSLGFNDTGTQMKQYLELLNDVVTNGLTKGDRTGTGTKAVFARQYRHNLADGFPLLTTKKLHFKSIANELIWMLSGNTNIKWLNENGVKIWDEWATEDGDLGPVYGEQWTAWPTKDGGKINQIDYMVETLKTNPNSRRILFHGWNPAVLDAVALPACHLLYQFIPNASTREISLCLYVRSNDIGLGTPFNIAEGAALLHLVARLTGYTPRWFTYFIGDAHIYENHLDMVEEQLKRTPFPAPRFVISDRVPDYAKTGKYEPEWLEKIEPSDFSLEGYEHHAPIKAAMAV